MKIESIILSNFRGASQKTVISFDASKSLSLIFGENGTGKSTIIDAFDFVCNKKYGSLSDYSIGKSVNKYLPSYGKTDTTSVELIGDTEKWQAILSNANIITSPDSKPAPQAIILRRSKIIELIENAPVDRFKVLNNFISVPNVKKIENAFRDAVKDTEKVFNENVRALSQANEALDAIWTDSGETKGTAIEWAKSQVKADSSKKQSIVFEIEKTMKDIDNINSKAQELISAKENGAIAKKSFDDAMSQQEAFEQTQKGKDKYLLELLKQSKDYLQNNKDIDKCPVCGTVQNIEEIKQEISERISDMESIENLTKITEQAKKELEQKMTIVKQSEIAFYNTLTTGIRAIKGATLEEIKNLEQLDATFFEDASKSREFSDSLLKSFSNWNTIFQGSNKAHLTTKKDSIQKEINLQLTIKTHLDTVETNKEKTVLKEKTLGELKSILDVIEKERKDYIEDILKIISQDVTKLYSELHPDESIGKPHFYLKPNVKASLEFDASFQGADGLPPQAYYSESHLDTLGICVFIAMANHYKNDSSILIFDDVLTSVDAQHMDRFIKLLHKQETNFNKIIITTHYRPWKDRYKYFRSEATNIDVVELSPWSLSVGIRTTEFKSAIPELKEALRTEIFDRQLTASKAGIILEAILDCLTVKYNCRLPRKAQNEYTLSELVGGIDKKLSKLLKVKKDSVEIEIKPLLEKAIEKDWIRNQVGCHFNLSGSDIFDQDIIDFATSVISLTETIICPNCGSIPSKDKTGGFWQCGCKDNPLELHPLRRPND